MDYEYHVQLISNRTWYYDDNSAEHEALKMFGMRLTVEAGGVADVFDPGYFTGTFLPQFLALLFLADTILRTFICYGHHVSCLATAIINSWSGVLRLVCCRGIGAKKWKRWEGARFVWYYRYLKLTTVNLAAIDFFLRSVERPKTEHDDDSLWVKPEWDEKCRKHFQASALNAEKGVLVHQITRSEMHKQLLKFERDVIKHRDQDGEPEWRKHVATGRSLEMECFDSDDVFHAHDEDAWEFCHAPGHSNFDETSDRDYIINMSRERPRELSNPSKPESKGICPQTERHLNTPDPTARGSGSNLCCLFQ